MDDEVEARAQKSCCRGRAGVAQVGWSCPLQVDGLVESGLEGAFGDLAEGRMRQHGVEHFGGGQLAAAGDAQRRDHVAGGAAEDVRAQDFAAAVVENDLDQALGFAGRLGFA